MALDGEDFQNVEGEASLLGACLIANEIIESVAQIVTADDFHEPLHARIYAQIVRSHDRGRPVTPVTLAPIFKRDPAMNELGGIGYLARLTGDGQGLLAPREIAEQIAELARMRAVRAGWESMRDGYLLGDTLEAASSHLDEALSGLHNMTLHAPVLSASQLIGKVRERSERMLSDAMGEHRGVQCKTIGDLNTLLGPVEDGTYIILAGRPSMGKTTIASSAAWGYAANGHPTLYLAAEGTDETLAMRLLSDMSLDSELAIPHDKIRRDQLKPETRAHIDRLQEQAEALPIDYQCVGRCDIRRLRGHVARVADKWKDQGRRLRVVVVDYLQLLDATENGRPITDDRRRVNAVSDGLLAIAKDFGLCMIALSQLSRAVESRPDKRPQVSDLRESGRLEEDADVVLLAYRSEYYLERSKPTQDMRNYQQLLEEWEAEYGRARDRVDLILGKNRHGDVRTRTAKFFGKFYACRGGDYDDSNSWSEPPLGF
jgi:replicative DNA helicase